MLFNASSIEEFRQIAKGNEVFEEMAATLEKMNEDQKIRWLANAREFHEMDMLQRYHDGYEDGVAAGKSAGYHVGKAEGILLGEIKGTVQICREDLQITDEEIIRKLMTKFDLSEEMARKYVVTAQY